MVDVVAEVMAALVGNHLGARWSDGGRRRRAARAFAAGRATVFPAWVLGRPAYCRAAGGLLVVTPEGLHHVVDRGMPGTRRHVPVERLVVVGRRTGTLEDHRQMPADWAVLECLDGDEPVLIACHGTEMRYVEAAFQRAR